MTSAYGQSYSASWWVWSEDQQLPGAVPHYINSTSSH